MTEISLVLTNNNYRRYDNTSWWWHRHWDTETQINMPSTQWNSCRN